MPINSRNWKASQRASDISGSEHLIEVSGQVELPSTSHVARLVRPEPQGINDSILILDLVVEQDGIGGSALTWRDVSHEEKPVEAGKYRQVTIRTEGSDLKTFDVEVIHSIADPDRR